MKTHLPMTIDCQYVLPRFAAAFLIQEEGKGAFIENNTAQSLPILLKALQSQGLKPEQVEYLIVTHVHLDHAGGTSALLRACPNATVLAHPRAVIHLVDPTKLIASATQVYGEDRFKKIYDEILPIPANRVRAVEDGEVMSFGSRQLKFIHTRGHANHHVCIYDSGSHGVFTGDSFGLAYPALQQQGLFIFPSTSPTDFDPKEAKLSVQKILDLRAERAFLTHFGEITELQEAASQLLAHLDFSENLLERATHLEMNLEGLHQFCLQEIHHYYQEVIQKRGLQFSSSQMQLLGLDLELNAAGIAHVAQKRKLKQTSSSPLK